VQQIHHSLANRAAFANTPLERYAHILLSEVCVCVFNLLVVLVTRILFCFGGYIACPCVCVCMCVCVVCVYVSCVSVCVVCVCRVYIYIYMCVCVCRVYIYVCLYVVCVYICVVCGYMCRVCMCVSCVDTCDGDITCSWAGLQIPEEFVRGRLRAGSHLVLDDRFEDLDYGKLCQLRKKLKRHILAHRSAEWYVLRALCSTCTCCVRFALPFLL